MGTLPAECIDQLPSRGLLVHISLQIVFIIRIMIIMCCSSVYDSVYVGWVTVCYV